MKEGISVLNDAFKLFITLNTTLLAAYLGFYDKISIETVWVKILPAALAVLSLIVSLIGFFPAGMKVDLAKPGDIKAYKLARAKSKGIFLLIAASLLISAFVALLIARASA